MNNGPRRVARPLLQWPVLCLVATSLAASAAAASTRGGVRTGTSTAAPGAARVRHVFLHGDWRLSNRENAIVARALAAVARTLGQEVLPPDKVQPVLTRLRQGWQADGQQCAVARTGARELLTALEASTELCGGGCELREVTWSIECSGRWQACAVDLRFRPGRDRSGAADLDDDDEEPRLEHYSLRIPQAVASRWKGVADLTRALTASRKADWRQPGSDDSFSNVFGAGGLLGSLLDGERSGHHERAVQAPGAHLEVERAASTNAPLWTLFAGQASAAKQGARRIPLERLGCWDHPRLQERTRVFARRGGRGLNVELDVADAELRACLLPVVQRALSREDRTLALLNLDLIVERGDVVSRDGRYILDVVARHERTQDPDWRKQKPRVSDPALADWRLPDDPRGFARCLVDFPFSDDYALRDSRKQARLHLYYEVGFDAQGRATTARFLLPAKKNTPAEQVSGEARACIVRAALGSSAPCTSAGGTARAWLTVTTARVLQGAGVPDAGAGD